jgi:CubicO group peptidase (beta-lactamase class C family)
LAFGASESPVAAPGQKWSYSNYGYNLLGRVVELTTGQDVSTAIHERIAEPLGLRRTLLATSGNGLSDPFTTDTGPAISRSARRQAPPMTPPRCRFMRVGGRGHDLHARRPARLVSRHGHW